MVSGAIAGEEDASSEWEDVVSEMDTPASQRFRRVSLSQSENTERTPLLRRRTSGGTHDADMEGQKSQRGKPWISRLFRRDQRKVQPDDGRYAVVENKRPWDWRRVCRSMFVTPATCLPAVCVGLLLNILDALSYGKMTFCKESMSGLVMLTIFRYGFVPIGQTHLRALGLCWNIHLLCQHYCFSVDIFLWEYFQGGCWLRTRKLEYLYDDLNELWG